MIVAYATIVNASTWLLVGYMHSNAPETLEK